MKSGQDDDDDVICAARFSSNHSFFSQFRRGKWDNLKRKSCESGSMEPLIGKIWKWSHRLQKILNFKIESPFVERLIHPTTRGWSTHSTPEAESGPLKSQREGATRRGAELGENHTRPCFDGTANRQNNYIIWALTQVFFNQCFIVHGLHSK